MFKKLIGSVFGLALFAMAGPASATVIFSDNFNRANSMTVGSGWVENPANRVEILNNQMQLIQTGSATQNNISTLGFEDIELSYDWRGSGAESNDVLSVLWSTDGFSSNSTTLATHTLATALGAQLSGSETFALGLSAEDLAAISIRFVIGGNMGNDFAFIDNVSLSGEPIPVIQVPEPSTIGMFGFGLIGLGIMTRRRRRPFESV